MQGKMRSKKNTRLERQQAIFEIPVVVHVIHNGEAIGSGTNISDAQILSQISVLNEDYRRMNSDASSTPSEFQSVAGNLDIRVCVGQTGSGGALHHGNCTRPGYENFVVHQ